MDWREAAAWPGLGTTGSVPALSGGVWVDTLTGPEVFVDTGEKRWFRFIDSQNRMGTAAPDLATCRFSFAVGPWGK